jgi:hypothetical protein
MPPAGQIQHRPQAPVPKPPPPQKPYYKLPAGLMLLAQVRMKAS